MFNRIKIGARLGLAFGLLMLLLGLLAGIADRQMQGLADNTNYYAVNLVPSYETQHAIALKLSERRRDESRYTTLTSASALQAADAQFANSQQQLGELLDKYAKDLLSDDEDKRGLEAVRASLAKYYTEWDAVRNLVQDGLQDSVKTEAAVQRLMGPSAAAYNAAQQAVDAWWAYNIKLARKQDELAAASYKAARLALWLTFLAALGIGVYSAVIISRSITRPLHQAVALSNAVAQGDLSSTLQVQGQDEAAQLMRALGQMNGNLARIVAQVRTSSDCIAIGSAEIATGNQNLSQRTEEQASALQQTAATMEQLGHTVRHNADSALQANQLAQGASEVAMQGGSVVGQVVDTMQGISDSSRRIGDIIGTIDGIAFQTNILALNAAVEAARAGEQGRGFAVVAAEVRSLAQRSADAAKEIKTLIGRNVEQVAHGAQLVDQAGKTMAELVSSVQRVSSIVAEITSASQQQSAGVQQVGEAVSQMDQTTQQNAALVEQSAAAAESLKGQAQQLVQAVAIFKLAGHATSAA